MRLHRVTRGAAILVLTPLVVACTDDVVSPTLRPDLALATTLKSGDVVRLRDVPELTMDLPEAAPPWHSDDSALVKTVTAANRRAYVAFKDEDRARVHATARLERAKEWRPDRMVKKGTRAAVSSGAIRAGLAFLEANGATVLKYFEALGLAYIELDPVRAPAIRSQPFVDYVEPEQTGYQLAVGGIWRREARAALATETIPWGIAAVNAPAAWSLTTGSGARLLIIDSGHQQDHQDLSAAPSGNCSFGSQNGCTDAFPVPHGTRVSGVALARSNALGVVGMAPGIAGSDVFYWGACNNLPTNQGGACFLSDIVDALDWAAMNLGPRGVINMSLAGPAYSSAVANAVARAWSAGHVIVAAAGNDTSNLLVYPAAHANVLGVSGVNQNLTFAAKGTTACLGYSNWGPQVDLSGPFDVYTTEPTNSYNYTCGTSFATPHVAGAALLVRAANPTWQNGRVVDQLIYTSRDVGAPGFDPYTGKGIVQADLAVGLYAPPATATIMNGRPRLSWSAIPLAAQYRIYRRVTPTLAPDWTLWATTTSLSYLDLSTNVSKLFGYNGQPSNTAVSYYVTAVSAGGFESSYHVYATYIPVGTPPY
jgi:hypothetical protein